MMQKLSYRDKLDSDIIRLLRFPLAVMVVFLHAEPAIQGWDIIKMSSANVGANISGCVMYSISHIITQIAVPAFFLISGYLFFRKLENWNKREWSRKIHSRVFTLIIPYVLWVCIFCIFHIVGHILPNCSIADNISTAVNAWICEQGGVLNLFWSSSVWTAGTNNVFNQKVLLSGPQPFHLWFVRDLIVMVLLSPLFYVLFRRNSFSKVRVISLISLLLLMGFYLLQVQLPFYGVGFTSLFYFGLGSFFSLNRLSLSDIFSRYRKLLIVVAIILYIILLPMDGSRTKYGIMLFPIFTFAGVGMLFCIAASYIGKYGGVEYMDKISKASFFMYMIHPFILSIVWSVLSMLLCHVFHVVSISDITFADAHPVAVLFLYFTKVTITILICVLIYSALAWLFPRVTKVLCGR